MTSFLEKNHYFKKEFLNKTFFTLFILSHTSDNTTSLNIGGTNACAVPHLKFGRAVHPSPPRAPGLRPWVTDNHFMMIDLTKQPETHFQAMQVMCTVGEGGKRLEKGI